ncbi:pro-sigmaK processing inhibitor BofA family protein [uncultured Ruthenibacterium sp.]|uniref:pro-sigmaK processing inhibitor BofA family protein n=1 Tax=uncultured Ruthenibacterium sp. TaxID=1905347 RepID=UPI00349E7105
MTFVQTVALCWAFVCIAGVAAVLSKTKHPFFSALKSAFCGAAALGAVNLMAGFTGVTIALNYATSFVAIVLGAPGVVLLLLMRVWILF